MIDRASLTPARRTVESSRDVPASPGGPVGEANRIGSAMRPAWLPGGGLAVLLAVPIVVVLTVGIALDNAPTTYLASALALGGAIVAPGVGAAVLILVSPLHPPDVIPAPGLNTLLVGAVLLGCIYRLPIDRPRLRLPAPLIVLGAFVLYVAVQQSPEMLGGYVGDVGHLVGYQFVQLVTCFATAVAVGYVLRDRDPRPFLAAGLASAVIAAVLAITTYDAASVPGPLARLLADADPGSRAAGPFGNPNYFGMFQAVAVTAAIAWFANARSWRRGLLLAAAGVCGLGLALTMSRGAIVALLVGVTVVAVMRFRFAGALLAGVLFVSALVLYPVFLQWRLGDELNSPTGQALAGLATSDAERAAAVLAGPRIFATAPLFGIGFGHYSFVSAQYSGNTVATAAHDWYVNVLAEEGLVGAVLWAMLMITVAAALIRRARPARAVGLAAFASLSAGSLFLEPPTSFQTSALPIVVITAALVADWAPSRRPITPETDDGP